MPAIRIRMLEEIVAENIAPLPPGRPPCDCRREEQLKRLESDIRTLKMQIAEKSTNIEHLIKTSETELEARLTAFRIAAKNDIDSVRKKRDEALANLEKVAETVRNLEMDLETVRNERDDAVAKLKTEHDTERQQRQEAVAKLETVLETVRKLETEREELRSDLEAAEHKAAEMEAARAKATEREAAAAQVQAAEQAAAVREATVTARLKTEWEASKVVQEAKQETDTVRERAKAVLESARNEFEKMRMERDKATEDLAAVRAELDAMRSQLAALQIQLGSERLQGTTEQVHFEAEVTEREAVHPADEPATRPKTSHQTSTKPNESSSLSVVFPTDSANASSSTRPRSAAISTSKRSLPPPATDVPLARRVRIQPQPLPQLAPTEAIPDSQNSVQDMPLIPNAQVPPPPPTPVVFGMRQLLPGQARNGDANVTINYPTPTVDLPPIQNDGFLEQWLREQNLNDIILRTAEVTRDLDIRRRFLMEGHLTPEQQEFVVSRIPPAYRSTSHYLYALARLALHCFNYEQAFALMFCFTRIHRDKVGNLLDRVNHL